MKIKIDDDLFNIAKRLKEIDKGYLVVFDTKRNRYEVRHEEIGDKICFVVPYKFLDERTLKYARMTSVQNSKKLFDVIEKNNNDLETKNYNQIREESEYKFREIFKYEKSTKEMNLKDSYKTKWV